MDLRILVVSDFHGAPSSLDNLQRFVGRAHDCLVIVGDLTNFGPMSSLEDAVRRIKAMNVPTLAVPGNCDPRQSVDVLDKYGINLHARSVKFKEITFIGLGGSNPTPFNTPFELSEAEIWEKLAALTRDVGGSDNWILVTHAPPLGTKADRIAEGAHVGSEGVRRHIEQKQPLAALCGHIHEARSVDRIGRTLIVNPGPLSKGYAAEIAVGEGRADAELLELQPI